MSSPVFWGKDRNRDTSDRLPPGQYLTDDFPVLSIGLTPQVSVDDWKLEILTESSLIRNYDFHAVSSDLQQDEWTKDIHCVTKWSKFDTEWGGILLDTVIADLAGDVDTDEFTHVLFYCADGYTTNLPIEDVLDRKCLIATRYNGEPIEPKHGGPVRTVIPHLYFWKSAKWLTKIEFLKTEKKGFWEEHGYHNYGDPWKEQRYAD